MDDEDYGASITSLTRRARHLKKTLDKFWRRWKREYLLELREHHRYSKITQTDTHPIKKGDLVTVYDDSHPWRLGLVQDYTNSSDGELRGASVRVISKTGRPILLRRPIQHLYPLEVSSSETRTDDEDSVPKDSVEPPQRRSSRVAAKHARDQIVGQLMD